MCRLRRFYLAAIADLLVTVMCASPTGEMGGVMLVAQRDGSC